MSEVRTETYWPALDGFRAIAVGVVVMYHFAPRVAPNGYVGVDCFFVLSGFLITRLLIDERTRTGGIDVGRFYIRRARRLFPALAALCVALAIVAPLAGDPREVIAGIVATTLYVSNWWIYAGHDTVLLQHSWTLSIEEQFYLVWPLVLPWLLRSRSVRISVGVLTIGLWLWISRFDHGGGTVWAVVNGTYERAFGIALGCALAFVPQVARRVPGWVVTGCLVALVWFVFSPTDHSLGMSLVPALVSVPIVAGLTLGRSGPFDLLLRSTPILWIGLRSYGLYLWHFPIGSLIAHHGPWEVGTVPAVTLSLAVSLIATELSYRWVEMPFRARTRRPTTTAIVGEA